jgi:hypothetical protein
MADDQYRDVARTVLRRKVEEEGRRERDRQDTQAEQDLKARAHEKAYAAVQADKERQAKELVSAFLDAMRRAGNPGARRYRRADWKTIPRWRFLQRVNYSKDDSSKLVPGRFGLVPGPWVIGWVLVERGAYFDDETHRTDFGTAGGPGLLLSSAGDFYTIGSAPPRENWAQPVDFGQCLTTILELPVLARCLLRYGVSP